MWVENRTTGGEQRRLYPLWEECIVFADKDSRCSQSHKCVRKALSELQCSCNVVKCGEKC